RARLDFQFSAHRADELATDREPDARAREVIPGFCRGATEWLKQIPQHVRSDALTRVRHAELEMRRIDCACRNLDSSGFRELHRVGGEIEEYAGKCMRMSEAPLGDGVMQP